MYPLTGHQVGSGPGRISFRLMVIGSASSGRFPACAIPFALLSAATLGQEMPSLRAFAPLPAGMK
jgi:hypothetical protein